MQGRVEAFIAGRGASDRFEDLALEVFALQFERVGLYRRFCESRGATPERVHDWRQIPALPTDAFRQPLEVPGEHERSFAFESSGTSAAGEARSIHRLSSLDTYALSAMTHFEAMVLADAPGPMSILLVGPTTTTHPASSLGRMFSWVAERWSDGEPACAFDAHGNVDVGAAVAWLEAAASATAPVLILGVTSALTAVLDEIRRAGRALRLPADSRIVDTGGSKAYSNPGARARSYSPRALLKAAWRHLHVPAYLCVNEYGMTEMLSQFYDDALATRVAGRLSPRAKVGPPWVRTSVVDPVRLEPVAEGERGLLRHFDLANWDSVSALQTYDLGRQAGAGFEVLGRAVGTSVRGCSELVRAVDAAHAASKLE